MASRLVGVPQQKSHCCPAWALLPCGRSATGNYNKPNITKMPLRVMYFRDASLGVGTHLHRYPVRRARSSCRNRPREVGYIPHTRAPFVGCLLGIVRVPLSKTLCEAEVSGCLPLVLFDCGKWLNSMVYVVWLYLIPSGMGGPSRAVTPVEAFARRKSIFHCAGRQIGGRLRCRRDVESACIKPGCEMPGVSCPASGTPGSFHVGTHFTIIETAVSCGASQSPRSEESKLSFSPTQSQATACVQNKRVVCA